MTLENARVLHKALLEVGRTNAAADIERRYPELKKKQKPAMCPATGAVAGTGKPLTKKEKVKNG